MIEMSPTDSTWGSSTWGSMHGWKARGAWSQISLGEIFCYWIFILSVFFFSRYSVDLESSIMSELKSWNPHCDAWYC